MADERIGGQDPLGDAEHLAPWDRRSFAHRYDVHRDDPSHVHLDHGAPGHDRADETAAANGIAPTHAGSPQASADPGAATEADRRGNDDRRIPAEGLPTLPVTWVREPPASGRSRRPVLVLVAVTLVLLGLASWIAIRPFHPANRAAASASPPVAPSSSLPPPYATDDFEGTTTSGWGRADVGGRWEIMARTATERQRYGVSNGRGKFTVGRRVRCTAFLAEPAVRDSDVTVTFASDILPTAGALYLGVLPRATSTEQGYAAELYVGRDHHIRAALVRQLDPYDVVRLPGATQTLPDTVLRDDVITVRAQAVGTHPTRLRAKVWWGEQAEPEQWTVSAMDDAPALQRTGGLAVTSYLSREAATAPALVSVLSVAARPASP